MAKAKYPAKDGHKVCCKCLKELPLSEFYFKTCGRFKYYDSKCHSCAASYTRKWYSENKERQYVAARRWLEKNRESQSLWQWRYHVRKKYGLSDEQTAILFTDPKCGVCGAEKPGNGRRRLCVDHCHKTGKVRGLLCVSCNSAIARMDEIPDWCEMATAYLTHAFTPANSP